MALYWGAAVALAALFWPRGIRRILFLASLLALSEWLRGRLFTGFPWNALGYAAEAFDGLSQIAAYIGIWGLTFLVILWASLPALLADSDLSRSGKLAAQCLMLSAFALWLTGTLRLDTAETRVTPGISMRIVQPSISQSDKWRTENAANIFDDLINLSIEPIAGRSAGAISSTHIVWPESSVPFLIDENPEALAAIGQALPDSAVLLMGSLRRAASDNRPKHEAHVYNSLLAIDGLGRIRAVYDKWHLVPYGEYLPLANWLEPLGLRRIVTVPGNFDRGLGTRTLAVSNTPGFSPLICYEAIFPLAVAETGRRPEWLLNITNDGWFGLTSGPYQHLAQARFRSIEEGLPLIRAANTGISAVIDAYGRVLDYLPLAKRGTIDTRLPAAIPPPPYARFGDLAFFLMLTLSAATVLFPSRARRPSAVG
jgi:apolipoprotein N-acyltransferase